MGRTREILRENDMHAGAHIAVLKALLRLYIAVLKVLLRLY